MATTNEMKNFISKDQMQITIFPLEIIIEILSRLPVKSLFKFKCVSKSWLSLISSSHFAKSHLKISSRNNKFSHKNLLLLSMYLPHTLCSCPLYSALHEKTISCINKLNFPWNPSNIIAGVSLCNGLFLICIGMYNNNLFLWNPSTRKTKKLPFSGNEYSRCDVTYGFGYDESNDDYKVVEINGVYGIHYVYGANLKIYSLKSNSWRRMKKYGDALFSPDSAVFVNGSLHWAVAHNDGVSTFWDTVSLNLENEQFGNLSLPNYDPGKCNGSSSRQLGDSSDFEPGILNWALGKLGDCLCLFCDYYKVKLDVWVMKDYKAKGSWTKSVSLPYTTGIGPRISPLWISDNGEVLLHDGSHVMVYDASKDEYKRVEIHEMDDNGVGAATVYAESLVSPDLDGTANTPELILY
ncbi:F-box/kelch-repeat protein At3g23880-like [Lycium ferocissimum]|uniref:F-box/kelch-repeat protein At3g23880-like n=1 Tax=Lycium ferocissimum TaxID=112874 RepID=UPI002815D8D1|nr:F-box/kelch-repeat protein At3g23880-like [Lycium ferocissimum]